MLWLCLALIIIGVIVQNETDNKKLGKIMWISGCVIIGIYLFLIIGMIFGLGVYALGECM